VGPLINFIRTERALSICADIANLSKHLKRRQKAPIDRNARPLLSGGAFEREPVRYEAVLFVQGRWPRRRACRASI